MGNFKENARPVSRPIMVAPEKAGANCAFKRVCCRKCITPQRPVIARETNALARKRAKKLIKKINMIDGAALDEKAVEKKIALAKELVFLLEGAAVPRRGGSVEYAFCGHSESKGMQVMQMFSPEEMAGILRGIHLHTNLEGAYMGASERSLPSGLHFAFSRLLAHRSAIELPGKRDALEELIMDGGMEGMRMVSRMAGEPTISLEKRKEYLKALKRVVSCAGFFDGNAKIKEDEYMLAASLSRFLPVESIGGQGCSADTVHFYHMGKPGPAAGISEPGLRQMALLAYSELFRGLVDISARINSIVLSSPEQIENYSGLGREYYAALEFGVGLLAGKEGGNREILLHMLEREGGNFYDAELGETVMLRHVVRKLNGKGMLARDAVEGIAFALGEGETEANWMLEKIGF